MRLLLVIQSERGNTFVHQWCRQDRTSNPRPPAQPGSPQCAHPLPAQSHCWCMSGCGASPKRVKFMLGMLRILGAATGHRWIRLQI